MRPVSLEVFGIETGWALSRSKIFETGRDAPVSSRSRRDGSTNNTKFEFIIWIRHFCHASDIFHLFCVAGLADFKFFQVFMS